MGLTNFFPRSNNLLTIFIQSFQAKLSDEISANSDFTFESIEVETRNKFFSIILTKN